MDRDPAGNATPLCGPSSVAARLVALDRAANAQFGGASTCMAYTPPPVALREGRCVADE